MQLKDLFNQSTAQRRDRILTGRISRTIFMLSLPTLMMAIVQSSMPIIDGLFIFNFVGSNTGAAVSYSVPIILLMSAVGQGLSVAGMSLIGQANGRGELSVARHISTQLFAAAFALGLCFIPIMAVLSLPISRGAGAEIGPIVLQYLLLMSITLPFTYMEFAYNAIKISNGKPEATFFRALIMLIFKLLFNFLFIYLLKLGIIGAVISTLLANIFVIFLMFYELFLKKSEDKLVIRGFRFEKDTLFQLIKIGTPAIFSAASINLGFILINIEVARFGDAALAGQSIAANISSLCFNLPASFASAVTAMVSINYGAGKGKRAKKCTNIGTLMACIAAVLLIAIVVPLSNSITTLFTHNREVIIIADRALHIFTYSVVGFAIVNVQLGAFIGLGKTMVTLVIGILRIWMLRYVFILATSAILGVDSVFWGNLFSNYAAAIITTILFLQIKWIDMKIPKTIELNELEFVSKK